MHRSTYHIDRRIKAPKTRSVQIGRVPALREIDIRPGEFGIVSYQKNAGIIGCGHPGNMVCTADFVVDFVSSLN